MNSHRFQFSVLQFSVFRVVQPNGNTKHSTSKLHTHTHAKTGPHMCVCVCCKCSWL